MKKIFTFCAAVAMLAACAKEAPKAPVANSLNAPAESGQSVAIQFKSNVVASVGTKAQGSFDAFNGNQNLYIFGYQRKAADLMTYADSAYIHNVSAVSPVLPAPDNYLNVKRVDEDGNLKPFYYVGNNTYDFYGYYVDDLVVEPVRSEDALYVPVDLTGGEDVMVAVADPSTDVQKSRDAGTFTGEADWNDRYAYSAYAARRGVHPSLTFKHKLVQFNFKIKSGYSQFRENGEQNPDLVVNRISVVARHKANLYVAGVSEKGVKQGFDDVDADLDTLVLKQFDSTTGQLVDMDEYIVPDKGTEALPTEAEAVGHSLMVLPNDAIDFVANPRAVDSYDVIVNMTYDGVDATYTGKIKFSDIDEAEKVDGQTQFTEGYAYEVTIKVYGLEPIEVSADMDEWKAGGKIFIDTDEKPEIL